MFVLLDRTSWFGSGDTTAGCRSRLNRESMCRRNLRGGDVAERGDCCFLNG